MIMILHLIIQQVQYECKLAHPCTGVLHKIRRSKSDKSRSLRNLHWLALTGTPYAIQGLHAPFHLENLTAERITAKK